jgi:hypothetical protein
VQRLVGIAAGEEVAGGLPREDVVGPEGGTAVEEEGDEAGCEADGKRHR